MRKERGNRERKEKKERKRGETGWQRERKVERKERRRKRKRDGERNEVQIMLFCCDKLKERLTFVTDHSDWRRRKENDSFL